jgi:hypothetical protein
MNRRHSHVKIRVEFEPNRFSSECLAKAYEQLKPVDSRIVSNERRKNEKAETLAAREGGTK